MTIFQLDLFCLAYEQAFSAKRVRVGECVAAERALRKALFERPSRSHDYHGRTYYIDAWEGLAWLDNAAVKAEQERKKSVAKLARLAKKEGVAA